ncbi:beta family protein [Massilia scottii]|uniref:beta family protein n=1 Tax=Massilia scottii TaxID=3057166 RepID=UPI002796DBBC|nr:hypothetical protein [Massilia sp. CCM 9029]MDQ1835228.1 hypothetical protein [Massilia sp. CCM 9029]
MASTWQYMPILKWKRGEQDALRYLDDEHWKELLPLLELMPISAAPEVAALTAALPVYSAHVAAQLTKSIPATTPLAIDSIYVSTGFTRQIGLLLQICKQVRKHVDHQIIPVFRARWLDMLPTLSPALTQQLQAFPELILRLRTDELEAAQVAPSLQALADFVGHRNIHLVIDQFSLVDRQHADCLAAVTPYLAAAVALSCASVTLAGGSFPINLTGKKAGATDLPRVEMKIWNHVRKDPIFADLRYGDYAVTNPVPMEEDIDPTKMNPSIAIRYASDDFWRLYKGRGFKKGPAGELRGLCQLLVTDPIYGGKTYSYGDSQYMAYSLGSDKNGIPWTWRRDATNRHIVHTIKTV